MSKSSSNDDSDAKKNTKTKNVLFSSLLFNLGREEDERNFDATSSSTTTTPFHHHHHAGGELARIIRARSTRFLTHASPTVAAVEENVASAIALARGDALTKTLEVHALMDADGRHVGRSLARVNEDFSTFFGVESEALAKTKRDIEALVEAKEKEREKEERKREKETKERRRKELKEAMMFRKEEE